MKVLLVVSLIVTLPATRQQPVCAIIGGSNLECDRPLETDCEADSEK